MPTFYKLSEEEIAALQRHGKKPIDLIPYMDFIRGFKTGEWGALTLAEGENPRAEKRRVTMAAKRENKQIRWRKAENGTMRFEVK